jgi:bifunctional non-homologous end joining protein LigD
VLYPETGFTKRDAVAYYAAVSKYLLPHLRNRPVSFKRYPDSIHNESFWEKDAPAFTPDWVPRFAVPRRADGSVIDYIVINNARTLKWVAEVGGIELHPFLHRIPHIDRAMAIVFDLDPGPGADLADCCEVALLLREALPLECYAKVSGSKGLQVYVPLNGAGVPHEITEAFARLVAEELARAHPKRIVAKMDKSLRRNKVFIDWSQNADYKTTVAVYSLRAKRDEPLISMPVTWEEVERARGLEWGPEAALKRLAKVGDLFAPVLKKKQKLLGVKAVPRGSSEFLGATSTRGTEEPRGTRGTASPRMPRPKSQSGRRLFVLTRTDSGNELWLDLHGRFKRWLLRRDREGDARLIAMPAGDIPIHPLYYEATVPKEWRDTVTIEDTGAYEIIEGSYAARRFDLWFSGKVMAGQWILQKVEDDAQHRSWSLAPRS